MRVLDPILALACLASAAHAAQDARQVTVLQRSWTVTQVAEMPLTYKAVRAPMPNYQFFGPPAVPMVVQAVRAIETATGCKVERNSMYQNMSADFFAQVRCN